MLVKVHTKDYIHNYLERYLFISWYYIQVVKCYSCIFSEKRETCDRVQSLVSSLQAFWSSGLQTSRPVQAYGPTGSSPTVHFYGLESTGYKHAMYCYHTPIMSTAHKQWAMMPPSMMKAIPRIVLGVQANLEYQRTSRLLDDIVQAMIIATIHVAMTKAMIQGIQAMIQAMTCRSSMAAIQFKIQNANDDGGDTSYLLRAQDTPNLQIVCHMWSYVMRHSGHCKPPCSQRKPYVRSHTSTEQVTRLKSLILGCLRTLREWHQRHILHRNIYLPSPQFETVICRTFLRVTSER